jgi:hypothetical protein
MLDGCPTTGVSDKSCPKNTGRTVYSRFLLPNITLDVKFSQPGDMSRLALAAPLVLEPSAPAALRVTPSLLPATVDLSTVCPPSGPGKRIPGNPLRGDHGCPTTSICGEATGQLRSGLTGGSKPRATGAFGSKEVLITCTLSRSHLVGSFPAALKLNFHILLCSRGVCGTCPTTHRGERRCQPDPANGRGMPGCPLPAWSRPEPQHPKTPCRIN